VCRALPYDRELKSIDNNTSKASLFIKGLSKDWSHKDLFEYFKPFGEITSVKISLNENHLSRGYGFVLFTREEFAQRALETVIFNMFSNLFIVEWSIIEPRMCPQSAKVPQNRLEARGIEKTL
jgi:RNA recognition motif-containing protein